MASKKTKAQLEKKWQGKIDVSRNAYNSVRKKNPDLPGFYNSVGYKDFDKRRKRAFARFKNRDIINERKRISYSIRKKIENELGDEELIDFISVFQAFSSTGRIVEETIVQNSVGKDFEGVIKINENDYIAKGNYAFSDYASFKIKVNQILSVLYKLGSDTVFSWTIQRFFKEEDSKLTVKYVFSDGDNDEDEEI